MDEIFYLGIFEHSLDSQGRVAIPSDWRRGDGETRFILYQNDKGQLVLFPFESFKEFLLEVQKASFANPKLQTLLQRFGARARECRCDKQGRIRLEKSFLDAAAISSQVTIVGAMSHIMLCAPSRWNPDEPISTAMAGDEKTGGIGDILSQLRKLLDEMK